MCDFKECEKQIIDTLLPEIAESCIIPLESCIDRTNRKISTISQTTRRSAIYIEQILSMLENEIYNARKVAKVPFNEGLGQITRANGDNDSKWDLYIVLGELWFTPHR